jgi:hypothetical protein
MATPIPEVRDPAGGFSPRHAGQIPARVVRRFLSYPGFTLMGMDAAQSDSMIAKGPGKIAAVKAKHPRAYEPWTPVDDARLVAGYQSGLGFNDLAAKFGRQPSAIESRLKKIALERLRTASI